MRSISSQNCRRDSGSTPVVGSSRISRSGSWISAQHRPSFCFMPPESLPAGRSGNGARPVPASSVVDARARARRGRGRTAGRRSRCSRDAEVGIEVPAEPLRHVGDARADRAAMRAHRPCRRRAPRPGRWICAGAGDQRQQRRLADAVGTDQADHAAGRDIERRSRRGRRADA